MKSAAHSLALVGCGLIMATMMACTPGGKEPGDQVGEVVSFDEGVLIYTDTGAPHGDALISGPLMRDPGCGFVIDDAALILPSTADIATDSFTIGRASFDVGEAVTLGGGGVSIPDLQGGTPMPCSTAAFFKVAWEQRE